MRLPRGKIGRRLTKQLHGLILNLPQLHQIRIIASTLPQQLFTQHRQRWERQMNRPPSPEEDADYVRAAVRYTSKLSLPVRAPLPYGPRSRRTCHLAFPAPPALRCHVRTPMHDIETPSVRPLRAKDIRHWCSPANRVTFDITVMRTLVRSGVVTNRE